MLPGVDPYLSRRETPHKPDVKHFGDDRLTVFSADDTLVADATSPVQVSLAGAPSKAKDQEDPMTQNLSIRGGLPAIVHG